MNQTSKIPSATGISPNAGRILRSGLEKPGTALFKMKVYFCRVDKSTGVVSKWEKTLFSNDYQDEIDQFASKEAKQRWKSLLNDHDYNIFKHFNGIKRFWSWINKVHENGDLGMAIIYANQIKEPSRDGTEWPIEIMRIVGKGHTL